MTPFNTVTKVPPISSSDILTKNDYLAIDNIKKPLYLISSSTINTGIIIRILILNFKKSIRNTAKNDEKSLINHPVHKLSISLPCLAFFPIIIIIKNIGIDTKIKTKAT